MKTLFIPLAVFIASCSSSALPRESTDLGMIAFPLGTYTSCAQATLNPNENVFLDVGGFQSGAAALTLTQSGTTLTSTYVDQNGLAQSLRFSATSSSSATLAAPAQLVPGAAGICVTGPGSEHHYPALMNVTAGALTYDAGAAFITLSGELHADGGTCGALASPASFWILCEARQGGAVPVSMAAAPPVPQLAAGPHSCTAELGFHGSVNGTDEYATGGGSGTLTLTQKGAELNAQYSGDASLTGALRFTATTATTANAEAGQTLETPCLLPISSGPSPSPEALPIAAGSLAVVGSTLFLSFSGAMPAGSSCPGAHVAGSVICSQ
jgi:hypothetical protein